MNATIPAKVFANVEWHLHNREHLVEIATAQQREAEKEALFARKRCMDGMPRGKGGYSDPTCKRAMAILQASDGIVSAGKWQDAIGWAFAYFEGQPIFELAATFYGMNVSLEAVARRMEIDRQVALRYRNSFVCTCAVAACSLGLIDTSNMK